jgi:hypothetical protein
MSKAIAALLSRKFIAMMTAMLLVVFAIDVEATAKLEFLKWIVGIFSAANVVQKFAPAQPIGEEK